jgi:hypothetical protein
MPADELIPLGDLPAIFRRDRTTVQRWIRSGALPAVQIGGSTYVRQHDLDAALTPRGNARVQVAAAKAEHGPDWLSPEQFALVRRVLDDALGQIASGRAAS